ncbi:DUF4180 domain-containing protein [Sporomusa aerivorans]|uniref:DUF4180 domain-containing protein n=1 Tax=Sporomusa aerivorans TaxID=204936 RepID=UPI00352A3BCA
MNYRVIEKDSKKYIECTSAEAPLTACFENNTHLLMLHAEALSDDFFKLKTGLAGQVLQKFINYQVKVAVILTSELKISEKFKEFLNESNKGNDFRVYGNIDEAESWLLTVK